MVQVDDFTRYPEVGVLYSLTARAVIPRLGSIFCQRNEFARRSRFTHRRVTPLWPEANGEANIVVKTIKKPIKIAKMETKIVSMKCRYF